MKLLYVLPEYPPHHGGGIATFYEALLPELVRQGHTVEVVLGSAFVSDGAAYTHEGVGVQYVESDRISRYYDLFSHYEAMPELRRTLAAAWAIHDQVEGGAGYDCVEVTDWGLLFVPWIVESAAPAVVQMHGSMGQIDYRDPNPAAVAQGHLLRMFETTLLPYARAMHTYSRANQAEWKRVTGREVTYIPPPLDLVAVESGGMHRDEAGLVVGRIQYWKGPIVLAEAFRLLSVDAPHVRWVGRDMPYEGHDSMSAYLHATYPDVWGTLIQPHGSVTPDEVARMQATADFVVVPSVWDVYNLTAVEAMRQGAVVICSAGAGAVDLIEDGVNGFSFPVNDAQALADTIRRVRALTPDMRASIASAARETVADQLAPQTIAAQKMQAYQEALKASPSAQPDPWIVAAARPTPGTQPPLSFLDAQPLSGIISYASHRLRDKVRTSLRTRF